MREPRPWEAVWAAVEGRFQGSILIPALPLTHCVNSGVFSLPVLSSSVKRR